MRYCVECRWCVVGVGGVEDARCIREDICYVAPGYSETRCIRERESTMPVACGTAGKFYSPREVND